VDICLEIEVEKMVDNFVDNSDLKWTTLFLAVIPMLLFSFPALSPIVLPSSC